MLTRPSLMHLYCDDKFAADKLRRPGLADETGAPWLAAGAVTPRQAPKTVGLARGLRAPDWLALRRR